MNTRLQDATTSWRFTHTKIDAHIAMRVCERLGLEVLHETSDQLTIKIPTGEVINKYMQMYRTSVDAQNKMFQRHLPS